MNNEKLKYLDPQVLAKLDNIKLRTRLAVEGFIIGLHKSPYHGFSVEFAEHRPYMAGDEVKHIDWKLYGKTDRFFVKQFEEETNLKCYIILDKSGSMEFKSNEISKFEYGGIISSALSYLMLKQQDAVGLILFDTKINRYIPPSAKFGHLDNILVEIQNAKLGGETKVAPIIHEMAEKIKKRGLIMLISDLMDDPYEIVQGLKHFKHKKHEVIVFQILDPQELNFRYKDNIKFVDRETGDSIISQPWYIRDSYIKTIFGIISFYKKELSQNKIDFAQLRTDQNVGIALTEFLKKRAKLR